MSTNVRLADELDIVKRERIIAFALLCFVIIFTICDVIEDLHEGSTLNHVLGEASVVGLCIAACLYLWRRVVGTWKANAASMNTQLATVREEATKWKEAHVTLSSGLSRALDEQLGDWGLSAAEKEIAFLLMKGLSFKEIADIRQTSENTVRQQAATVYRKSGLEGRSQLSAFFLEDLLTFNQVA